MKFQYLHVVDLDAANVNVLRELEIMTNGNVAVLLLQSLVDLQRQP